MPLGLGRATTLSDLGDVRLLQPRHRADERPVGWIVDADHVVTGSDGRAVIGTGVDDTGVLGEKGGLGALDKRSVISTLNGMNPPIPHAGVAGIAVAVPSGRLPQALVADAWGTPVGRGARAVAGADEDVITLAVEAGQRVLKDSSVSARDVRIVLLATTTPAFEEKLGTAVAALALDLAADVRTVDLGHTLRGGLDAVQAGAEAVAAAGGAALILAADCRTPAPGAASESQQGHAAAAVLLTADGDIATIEAFSSVAEEVTSRWREPGATAVREYQPRLEAHIDATELIPTVMAAALDAARLGGEDIGVLCVTSLEPRGVRKSGERLGLDRAASPPNLRTDIGYTGTAAPVIALAQALAQAEASQRILCVATGDGATAIVLRRGEGALPDPIAPALSRSREVRSYAEYLAAHGLVSDESPNVSSVSPVTYWRHRETILRRRGLRCAECGLLDYPAGRGCARCGAVDGRLPERLGDVGKVVTFTHDHLVGGRYSERPTTRCVIEFDGEARFYTSMTDADPADVYIGMPVELVLRRRAVGAFPDYGWRCRPAGVA